jgi:hypothetical protein
LEGGRHNRWSEEGTEVVGLTPCGRATVAALQLNRPEVVGARWLWVQAGGGLLRINSKRRPDDGFL